MVTAHFFRQGTSHPSKGTVSMLQTLETVWAPRVLTLVRIVAALIFLEHGTQKLFGFPPSPNPGPALFSLYGYQGMIELVGGVLLALGLFTRPVAFILAGDMAGAFFISHSTAHFFPV